MTTKTTGVIAAGFLAIGIVVGAAGTIVARDDVAPDMADYRRDMPSMMGAGSMDDMASMMGDMASMMGDMASTMSMMDGDSPMTPSASMGPGASMLSGEQESHHASPSPEATR